MTLISMQSSPELNFEKSFARLEELLDKLNSGTLSLDESIALYEEADRLIAGCSKQLQEAERKIEVLVKGRNGELVVGPQGPMTERR